MNYYFEVAHKVLNIVRIWLEHISSKGVIWAEYLPTANYFKFDERMPTNLHMSCKFWIKYFFYSFGFFHYLSGSVPAYWDFEHHEKKTNSHILIKVF